MSTATDAAATADARRSADARGTPHPHARATGTDGAPDPAAASGASTSPFAELHGLATQLRTIAGFYVQTRIDRVRVAVAKAIGWVMLFAALAVIGVAVLMSAAFFVVAGAIQALGAVIHAPGVPALIVGGAIIALSVAAVLVIRAKLRGALRKKLAAKYRDHYVRQRADLGADVAQLAGRPHAAMGTPAASRTAQERQP